jgi:anti-sigma28 factor (negative regulator of flagellin synthesis)
MEVLSQVLNEDELGFIENKKVEEIREALSQISYKINALRTAALKNHKPY